ncbi:MULTISPECIES: hypothetical protein [unclassified Streptomyces]|uniref:hypothetical protein n=1 Tax=unclassified Streptomyces TaxID=2593676 RepID=UPI0037F97334
MSRRTDLPSPTHVAQVLDELLNTCRSTGRQPSVLDLARRFGLSNTTFRRNYPDAVSKITAARSPQNQPAASAGPSPNGRLAARNAKLRRSNRELTATLKLAIAQIHRLSTENHRLRAELEAVTGVTRLTDRIPGRRTPQ